MDVISYRLPNGKSSPPDKTVEQFPDCQQNLEIIINDATRDSSTLDLAQYNIESLHTR